MRRSGRHGQEWWMELEREPSYLVSSHGRCLSLRTSTFLTPAMHDVRSEAGRLGVLVWYCTRSGPGRHQLIVHAAAAVLTAFYRPRPGRNWVVEYIDGDRTNIHVDNLSWIPHMAPEQYADMARRKNRLNPNNYSEMARRKHQLRRQREAREGEV